MERLNAGILAALITLPLAACEPVSDPWVSGRQAEMLEGERTRSPEQAQELRGRLERYGDAYQ